MKLMRLLVGSLGVRQATSFLRCAASPQARRFHFVISPLPLPRRSLDPASCWGCSCVIASRRVTPRTHAAAAAAAAAGLSSYAACFHFPRRHTQGIGAATAGSRAASRWVRGAVLAWHGVGLTLDLMMGWPRWRRQGGGNRGGYRRHHCRHGLSPPAHDCVPLGTAALVSPTPTPSPSAVVVEYGRWGPRRRDAVVAGDQVALLHGPPREQRAAAHR
jgi:hypothetical protein